MKKSILILLFIFTSLSGFAEQVIDNASFNIFAKYGNTDSSYTLSIVNLYADANSEIANNQKIPVSVDDYDSEKTGKEFLELFKVVFKHTGTYDNQNPYIIGIDTSKGFEYWDQEAQKEETVGSTRYNLSAKVNPESNLVLTSDAQNLEPSNPGNSLTKDCPIAFTENNIFTDFTYELTVGVKVNEDGNNSYTSFYEEYLENVKDKAVAELTFTVSLEAS